jgi:CPA2 family monovalent cation:H+ antiporter-2
VTLLGYGSKVGLGVAVALAQIGEFSLILATVGDQLNIFPEGATNLIVAGSIISLTLNPLLYRVISRLDSTLSRFPRIWHILNPKPHCVEVGNEDTGMTATYRTVVVGYGPIGQTVARLLREGGIETVIIDTNLETTRRVRAEGHRAVYGDAMHAEVLEAAGIRNAVSLVVSGPTSEQAAEIIRLARSLNSNLRVISRSYYLRETAIMRQAGADEVFSGEGEVALAMTEYILSSLGATPEQIERERQRVREQVFTA